MEEIDLLAIELLEHLLERPLNEEVACNQAFVSLVIEPSPNLGSDLDLDLLTMSGDLRGLRLG